MNCNYLAVSYHGPVDFPSHASQEIDVGEVVSAARELRGTMYDPLKGKLGNPGGKLGFGRMLANGEVPYIKALKLTVRPARAVAGSTPAPVRRAA